jgi:thiol-disulfide isomerase/thioredoxin
VNGKPFLDVNTKDIEGDRFDMSANKGRTLTVFNVWATWCEPCIHELPYLEKLTQEYEDEGVRVIGIMLDAVGTDGKIDNNAIIAAKKILLEAKVTYPSIVPEKTLLGGVLKTDEGIPVTYIVGPDGKIVDEILGSREYDAWSEIIDSALKKIQK